MKKGVSGFQLNRDTNERKALFRALVSSMVENGFLETTITKAKSIQPTVEKLVTKAKKGGLSDRRIALRFLNKTYLVSRLFEVIGPSFKTRNGGYTKIVKLGVRKGDGSQIVKLLFTEELPLDIKTMPAKTVAEKETTPIKVGKTIKNKKQSKLSKKTVK